MTALPRVTKETGYAVCRELEREDNNDYVIRLLERLRRSPLLQLCEVNLLLKRLHLRETRFR